MNLTGIAIAALTTSLCLPLLVLASTGSTGSTCGSPGPAPTRSGRPAPTTVMPRAAHPGAPVPSTLDAVRLVPQRGATPAPGMEGISIVAGAAGCLLGGGDGKPNGGSIPLPIGFTLPPNTPPAVVKAVTWALAQLGTPYSWGGDCTAPHAGQAAHECDCSSLVQAAYLAGDAQLPRTTSGQVRAGAPVTDLRLLLPGDLVFIAGADGTMDAPGHVGLYLGDGLIEHAPKTGDHVKLAAITTWTPIAAVRRIVTWS